MHKISQLRGRIELMGLNEFSATDLHRVDLDSIAWCGDALHLDIMRQQLDQAVVDGMVMSETLAVRYIDGTVVAKGYVQHLPSLSKSVISQLATHPQLQSLGLGSMLMSALEARVLAQNIRCVELGVEQSNGKARLLYERLGYRFARTAQDSWQAIDGNGIEYVHSTQVDWLEKHLVST